ncbi:MAG: gfo/Idh/MocA family oxidoreductase, partial [Deltaproteobacteria bacterium]
WQGSKRWRNGEGGWEPFGTGYDKIEAFTRQIENFCRAIRGEEALRITPEDALASVEVIETAYAALAESSWRSVVHS